MPAKRSSNTKQPAKHTKAPMSPERAALINDLVGVGLIVLALCMIVAVITPSTAVVTHALSEGLKLGFGEGALLVPIAIILFAITLFLPTDNGIVARVAVGLALILLAILSMLSVMAPSIEKDPSMILEAEVAQIYGGYVGSGIAYVLLTGVGQIAAMVILSGLAVAGVVVCGFSISNLALKIRQSMSSAAQHIAQSRENGSTRRHSGKADMYEPQAYVEPETNVLDEQATTYIGKRKGSVLRRDTLGSGVNHQNATASLDPAMGYAVAPEPATSILGRKAPVTTRLTRKSKKGANTAEVSATESNLAPFEQPVHIDEPVIPDFLKAAAAGAAEAETTKITRSKSNSSAPSKSSQKAGGKSKAKTVKAPSSTVRPGESSNDFKLPPMSLLKSNPNSASSASSDTELDRTASRLQATLEEFGLTSHVVGWTSGPMVTTFKIQMGEGERVNKITNLQDDIQLSLASESVRIFAPIPGTSLVGIEIPNKKRQNVCLGDVLPYAQGGPLEFAIGRDSEGSPVVADLSKMPHMLVAGTTGSGKSVLINAIIMSLVMRTTPEQVRLILVDPKRVEFGCYAGLPHLYVPVVTEPRQAASALQWAVTEMDRRLKVFERAGARDITIYNNMVESGKFADMENPPSPLPYLVIVIDELSDLMMVAGKDVEASIVRIAQLARAAGIHLVLATQRPSANVVTGLIKSNVDTRVALKVSSGIDSRVILDATGAERLMGRGDMLFRKAGGVLRRVLGAYASDAEISSVVDFIRDQREPDYHDEILSAVVPGQTVSGGTGGSFGADDDTDPLFWEAAQIVVDSQLGSTSGLQRRLKVGYARAGRIMDELESKGVVGPPDGSKPREVLLDEEGLEELRSAEAAYREV